MLYNFIIFKFVQPIGAMTITNDKNIYVYLPYTTLYTVLFELANR